jgi:cobalt/nickel transport system permease protein
MHIPDGFLSPPVWVALDAVSLPAVGWVARRARRDQTDARMPLLGMMGAFVFAAQMINFPLAAGTSGHLLGGALLAIVLRPAAAALVMTAILVLQALIFQDGGVLALGANVFNMALVGVAAGYLPVRLWGRAAPAVFLGGLLSVTASGMLALAELLASGVALAPNLVWLSLGLFLASGCVEGAITVAAVRSIERLSTAPLAGAGGSRVRAAVALAALIALAGGVFLASASPDTLEYLGAALDLTDAPAWAHAAFPGYEAGVWGGAAGRKAAAGLAGLMLVYAVCAAGSRKR